MSAVANPAQSKFIRPELFQIGGGEAAPANSRMTRPELFPLPPAPPAPKPLPDPTRVNAVGLPINPNTGRPIETGDPVFPDKPTPSSPYQYPTTPTGLLNMIGDTISSDTPILDIERGVEAGRQGLISNVMDVIGTGAGIIGADQDSQAFHVGASQNRDTSTAGMRGMPGEQIGQTLFQAVQTAPLLAVAAGRNTGAVGPRMALAGNVAGYGTFGAGAAGQGIAQYRDYMQSIQQQPDPLHEAAIGASYATAEILGERLGISQTAARYQSLADRTAAGLLQRNVPAVAASVMDLAVIGGVNMVEEQATQIAQNIVDRSYNQDTGMFDGVDEAGMQGLLQGVLTGGAGVTHGTLSRPTREAAPGPAVRRAPQDPAQLANRAEQPVERVPEAVTVHGQPPEADLQTQSRSIPDLLVPESAPTDAAPQLPRTPESQEQIRAATQKTPETSMTPVADQTEPSRRIEVDPRTSDRARDYSSMTTAQLKAEAKRRGLDPVGGHRTLVERIQGNQNTRSTPTTPDTPQDRQATQGQFLPESHRTPAQPDSEGTQPSQPSPTSDLSSLPVKDLKALAAARGLPVVGGKRTLVERLSKPQDTSQPSQRRPGDSGSASRAEVPAPAESVVASSSPAVEPQISPSPTVAADAAGSPAPKTLPELRAAHPSVKFTLSKGILTPSTLDGERLHDWREAATGMPIKRQIVEIHGRLQQRSLVLPKEGQNAVDRLGDLLKPGDENVSMGAAPNPTQERGPGGLLRQRMRSASDLVQSDTARDTHGVKFGSEETEGRYREARKGLEKLSLLTRMRGIIENVRKGFRGGALPELPRTSQFAEARSQTRKVMNAQQVAADRTEQVIARTIKPLDTADYDLFTRKVILDDLAKTEGALPFGLTEKQAEAELAKINKAIEGNSKVKASVEYRKKLWPAVKEDYIAAMDAMGVDVATKLTREDYFRHQVLFYARQRQLEKAGLPAVPGNHGQPQVNTRRGFLKERHGSELDINANYVQAEWEVMAQMIADTQVAKALAGIKKKYDIYPKLAQQVLEANNSGQPMFLSEVIPPTHQLYVVRPGQSMFSVLTVPEQAAWEAIESGADILNIPVDKLREQMAIGAPFTPMVLPKEVAKQLEALPKYRPQGGPAEKFIRQSLRAWKVYQLHSPLRVLRYNIRNASEVEKVATINPSALREIPQAIKDLYQFYKQSEDAPSDVREWAELGGASLVRVNELEDVPNLERLSRKIDDDTKAKKIANLPRRAWRGYWETVGKMSDFRESVLRYAMYRDYKRQMGENDGKPKNYGASNRKEIDGIAGVNDKAYRLSADVMGDYGDVSRFGQWMRTHAFPFWSFKELNFRTYVNAMKNMAIDGRTAPQIAKAFLPAGVRAGAGATMTVAKYAALLYGARALTQAWNYLFGGDIEKELPPEVQRSVHVILGRDSNGKPIYFDRLGTSQDFLKWFGADAVDADFRDLLSNRRTLSEVARGMVKKPIKELTGGITPMLTLPAETITGRTLYPDPFRPGKINADSDRIQHIFAEFGLDRAYRNMIGKPVEPKSASDRLLNLAVYTMDPDRAAYYRILDEKDRFRENAGLSVGGVFEGERSNALRNAKLSVRYGDPAMAAKFLRRYFELGGTTRGIKASFDAMEPLHGLSKEDQRHFVESLSGDDADALDGAERYFEEVLKGDPDDLRDAIDEARDD